MAPGLMSPPTSHVACSYGCTRASVLEKGGAPVLVLGCPRLLRCPTSALGWLFDLCSRSSPSPPAGSGGHIGLTSPSRHSPSFSGPEGDRGLRGARGKRLVLLHLGGIGIGPQIRGIRKPMGTAGPVRSVLGVVGRT